MDERETTHQVAAALDALGVPYMVVGSISSNYYGIPRSTEDVDFVIQKGRPTLTELLSQLSDDFQTDGQLRFESITGRTHFLLENSKSGYSVELFHLGSEDFDQSRFARRVSKELGGRSVWLPTCEDVVVQKLRWWSIGRRQKDFDDARDVVLVQTDNLDWSYIEHWCDELGCRGDLDQLRQIAAQE